MAALPGPTWPRVQLYRVTVGGPCYTRAMSDEQFPTPSRIEPRGEPPDHGDRARRVPYDMDTARSAARARLLLWMAQHGGRRPGHE